MRSIAASGIFAGVLQLGINYFSEQCKFMFQPLIATVTSAASTAATKRWEKAKALKRKQAKDMQDTGVMQTSQNF